MLVDRDCGDECDRCVIVSLRFDPPWQRFLLFERDIPFLAWRAITDGPSLAPRWNVNDEPHPH